MVWVHISALHSVIIHLVHRVSAMNCAKIYNAAEVRHVLGFADKNWQFLSKLTTKNVWDGFAIVILLEDHAQHHTWLLVPHTGNQNHWFADTMATQNSCIVREEQYEIFHYCDKCMRTFPYGDSLYKIEAVVTNGLTIGHPCCLVFTSKEPLTNNQHYFCPTHAHLCLQWSIVGCMEPVVGLSTVALALHTKACSDPLHWEIKWLHKEQSCTNFQLLQKLMQQKVEHPNTAVADKEVSDLTNLEDIEEWYEVDCTSHEIHMFSINNPGATRVLDLTTAAAPCPTHPELGNHKVKAQFGQCCTHN